LDKFSYSKVPPKSNICIILFEFGWILKYFKAL
jgi:hypothetical protein